MNLLKGILLDIIFKYFIQNELLYNEVGILINILKFKKIFLILKTYKKHRKINIKSVVVRLTIFLHLFEIFIILLIKLIYLQNTNI